MITVNRTESQYSTSMTWQPGPHDADRSGERSPAASGAANSSHADLAAIAALLYRLTDLEHVAAVPSQRGVGADHDHVVDDVAVRERDWWIEWRPRQAAARHEWNVEFLDLGPHVFRPCPIPAEFLLVEHGNGSTRLAEATDDLVEDLTAQVQQPSALVCGPGTVFTDDDHAVDVQFAATSTERSSNRVEQGDIVFGGHRNANVWPPITPSAAISMRCMATASHRDAST